MITLVVILHLLVSAILILVIMLQSGKAGDLASAFGGATSQAAFGARGAATMLTKVTTVCAITFMCTSLGLAILYSRQSATTVMDQVPAAEETTTSPVPAVPAETQPTPPPGDSSSDEGEPQ
jgi:preprotein translocase subunit SecG